MHARRIAGSVAVVVASGCGSSSRGPETVTIAPIAAASTSAPPPASASLDPAPPETPTAPSGYVEMHVLRVEAGPGGDGVVLLTDASETMVLPIFVGGTEALSISLRFEHGKYPRPLTHDLLDAAVRRLGAKLYEAQIDSPKDGVYLGRVFLRKGNQLLDLDARPSDAIALALGSGAPIFVARPVIDEAGQHPEGADGGLPHAAR